MSIVSTDTPTCHWLRAAAAVNKPGENMTISRPVPLQDTASAIWKTTTPTMTMYRVTLRSAGNTDHGEFFDEAVLSPTLEVECASIAGCQKAAANYRDPYGLGGGNWAGGGFGDGQGRCRRGGQLQPPRS